MNYHLKSMVLTRIIAEVTVFAILLVLPLVAFVLGYFNQMPITWSVLICLLSLVSAIFLPAYGYITWKVQVTDAGLVARSLWQLQKCEWKNVKGVSRRSNWNWQRYIVEGEGGDLSFPVWLKDVDKLVATIKSRLPQGASSRNPFRKYSQDPISLTFQIFQAFIGLALTTIFWLFLIQLWQEKATSTNDLLIVLGFCLVLTGCIAWRTYLILLMPKKIHVKRGSLKIDTLFFTKEYPWNEIRQIKESLPLLPEGYLIKTKNHSYLIDSGMDALDELIASVNSNLQSPSSVTDNTI